MAQAITNPNLTRSALPATTLTSAISVADLDNQYRERFFLDDIATVEYLNRYDSVMMKFYDMIGAGSVSATSPVINWTEASRLENGTRLSTAINTTATYLVLEDPGICNVGMFIYAPTTGEWMEVLEVDLDSGLSESTNVRVSRGAAGTTAKTIAANTAIIAQAQVMGEKDYPRPGQGTMPGQSQYNFGSLIGKTYSVTRLNQNTMIKGGWGQLERERAMNMYALRREVGQGLIFQPRWVEDTGSRGPRYFAGGWTHFVKTNILTLDSDPSRHTPEVYNEFAYNLFEHDASSSEKIAFAGRNLYFAKKKVARDNGKYGVASEDAARLGKEDFLEETDYGVIRWVLDENDFPQNRNFNLGDWAVVVDPANVESYTLSGFDSWQIVPDIQEKKQGITIREDAIVGSIGIAPKFEQTHGIIRGAPSHIINRAEVL